METGLIRWRDRWTSGAGLPTIPLERGGKRPVCAAWQMRSPADQWQEVGGAGFRGNIGVIPGGPPGVAVIDCDSPAAVQAVGRGLDGLGVDPERLPTVETASGNRHIYVRVKDAPQGNYCKLSPSIGPGELRFGPGCYLTAPCSAVGGQRYHFVVGAPEAIPRLRPVKWADLTWLVTPALELVTRPALNLTAPPVRLLWREAPDRAGWLLGIAATAGKGKPIMSKDHRGQAVLYASRSEGEAAALAMLLLCGWSFDEIAAAFRRCQPGHYQERGRSRDRYLEQSYRAVLSNVAGNLTRLEVAEAYRWAEAQPWPGRGGLLERAVYLGLLATGWQWDTWQPYAATRDLAEYAAAQRDAVTHALGRLQAAGLIRWCGTHPHYKTARWDLSSAQIPCHKSHIVGGSAAKEAAEGAGVAEVWAKVGRSAAVAFEWLGAAPSLSVDLERVMGKSRETVRAALRRLEVYGLAVQLEGGGWVRGPASIGDVGQEVQADRAAALRREAHNRQRQAWQEAREP